MIIKLIEEDDGTLTSNDELDLMITRPNTRTTACAADVVSIESLGESFKLFERYGCKSVYLTCMQPNTLVCFKNISYISKLKSLTLDIYQKKTTLNFLPETGEGLSNLVEFKLKSIESVTFDQFNEMKGLKKLYVSYHKKALGWKDHEGVVELTVSKFKGDDLSSLENMKSLKKLEIIQGSLKSLDGIEKLEHLETLHIHSLRNLTSLDALLKSTSLKNLIFESYTKTTDWRFLSAMKQLRQLNLTIADSIVFTENLPNLIFCHSRKILDKNRDPEMVINQRYEEQKLTGPLPGFIPLVDPLE